MSTARDIVYTATKTASLYHADRSSVKGLIGPVGCGKSVASCIQIMAYIKQQAPCADGIRRSRWAIIRNTYPELKATTMKTWSAWFPPEYFGKIKYDSPINQLIKFDDVEAEILFLALDFPNDVKKLKSLELTGAYINELQFIDELLFKTCRERTNRYPGRLEGVSPTWTGVLWDANPPSTLHWMYGTFEKGKPKEYSVYRYEPALLITQQIPDHGIYAISKNDTIYAPNPNADYIHVQQDPHYWLKLVSGNTDESIKVDLLGMYGVVISGRAVHETYNDKIHYTGKSLFYNKLIRLGLAFDFGLTPACAITQISANGQFQMLDEKWAIHMGLRDFLKNILLPHLDQNYEGWRLNYDSVHDPAGSQGAQTDGNTCQNVLKEEGIISKPAASTNSITSRRDGLKSFLARMVDGQPAFIMSDKCQLAREGLMGHFQYPRIQAGGDARYHETPLKNIHSHICEALEYRAMRDCSEYKKQSAPKPKSRRYNQSSFMSR